MAKKLLDEVIAQAPNRRRFLRKIAMASAATAAVGAIANTGNAQTTPPAGPSDADILNFALNLEYLEAEFYTVATQGKTIDQVGIGINGSGNQGTTTGGNQVTFTDNATRDNANQIAADERAHVTLIRAGLTAAGATPISKPQIKLNALGIGFNNQTEFLTLARAFEDVGVTAYAGAAPLITDKTILGVAARIAEVESEHAAGIRQLVARLGVPTMQLDGVDILPPPTGTKYFSVDDMGLTQIRTPGQVLFIVYGNTANATSGGFFPNGVNGAINMSSAGIPIPNAPPPPPPPPPPPAPVLAMVTNQMAATTSLQIVLDATASTSPNGGITKYAYSVAPGSKVPAILQNTQANPMATIQFVSGPGTYSLLLTVTDANGVSSAPIPITLNYQGK